MAKADESFAPEQVSASAERAVEIAASAGPRAPRLVDEWIRTGNSAAVQAVAEGGAGAARKAAKRGLNVLRARGVQIPASAARTGQVSISSSPAKQAWLLPPDSTGAEGIVLAERLASGSYQAAFAYFRESQNLLRVQSGQIGLSRIKEMMQQALGGAGYAPVSVPWEWAQHRIVERRAWHAARRVPEPLGMMGVEKLLAGVPGEPPPHPFDEEGLALAPEDAEKVARESGILHTWPEFRGWLPGEQVVQQMLFNLGRKLGPEPPSDKETLEPIVKEQVRAATDRYFTPERRAVLARRMKDSGLSVLARLGEHAALQVAGVIQVIEGAGLITNPPSDVKFLTGFFDKAIALLAARQGGQLRIPIPRAAAKAPTEAGEGPEQEAGGETETLEDSSDLSTAPDPLDPEVPAAPAPA